VVADIGGVAAMNGGRMLEGCWGISQDGVDRRGCVRRGTAAAALKERK
jgi:hypothetical protein